MSIEWPVFLLLVLVSYVSPGPDTVMILRASAHGHRTGLLAAAGALTGLAVHMLISAVGLSALLLALPGSLTVLTLVGAAYLASLGIRALVASSRLRKRPPRAHSTAAAPPGEGNDWGVFRRTLVTNVINPKVILFFVAVLPQFLDPASTWPVAMQLGTLGTIDVLMGVLYLPLLVTFGARIFTGLGPRGTANLELSVGLVLLLFASLLTLEVTNA